MFPVKETFLIRGSAEASEDDFFFHFFTINTCQSDKPSARQSKPDIFTDELSAPRLYPGVWMLHTLAPSEEAKFHKCHRVPLTSLCQVFPSL